jgi:hypothetical protein
MPDEDDEEEDDEDEDDEELGGFCGGFGLDPPLLHPCKARAPIVNSNNARFFKVSLLYAYTYDVICLSFCCSLHPWFGTPGFCLPVIAISAAPSIEAA